MVVGGGDSAMTEAEHLAKYGSEVIIVHRRDELRASKMLADRVLANPEGPGGVEFHGGGHPGGRLRHRDPARGYRYGEERTLECKGVFMAIGHTPNTAFLEMRCP